MCGHIQGSPWGFYSKKTTTGTRLANGFETRTIHKDVPTNRPRANIQIATRIMGGCTAKSLISNAWHHYLTLQKNEIICHQTKSLFSKQRLGIHFGHRDPHKFDKFGELFPLASVKWEVRMDNAGS
jgi:hypothetical protein